MDPDSKYPICENTHCGLNEKLLSSCTKCIYLFIFGSCLNWSILTSRAELSQTETRSWASPKEQDDLSDINIHKLSPVFYLDLNSGRSTEEAGSTPTSQNSHLSAAHPAITVFGLCSLKLTLQLYYCDNKKKQTALTHLLIFMAFLSAVLNSWSGPKHLL